MNLYIYLNRRASRRGLFNRRTSSCDHIINGVGFCAWFIQFEVCKLYTQRIISVVCQSSIEFLKIEGFSLFFSFFIQKCRKSNNVQVREKKKIQLRKFTRDKKRSYFNMLRNSFLFSCQI